jgi:NAD(P)-dependent dehydrogenase (short-subunit alcohol dehydrogenase family)
MDNKTVIITGGASNLGKSLVTTFAAKGWNVHATVRNASDEGLFSHPNVSYHTLDLTDTNSIYNTINTIAKQSNIDALINNAGFVLSGPFENYSDEQIRREMEVNFFGSLFTIKAVLPFLKTQQQGVIVNISSLCGLLTFPMLSVYHASKWAIEGFSESLMYELEPFNIKIKLIEPGGIKENNYSANIEFAATPTPEYTDLINKVHHSNWFPSFSEPDNIAKRIFEITNDNSSQLRYRIGADSDLLYNERINNLDQEKHLDKIRQRISNK